MIDDKAQDKLNGKLRGVTRRSPDLPAPQVLVQGPGWSWEFGERTLPYHAASVGKVMTATLVAQLVEQGRFAFETPIGELLPDTDTAGWRTKPGVTVARDVTVEHLLMHTSGLPDYFETPKGVETQASVKTAIEHPERRWTPSELLDEARTRPPEGRPGERFAYGDTGFVLLGRIVEEALGERFNDALRDRVLLPAGMQHSSTPYSDARTAADLADLEIAPIRIHGRDLTRALSLSLDWAGGGIVTTLDDQVRFQRALHAGELVSSATVERMARVRHRRRLGIYNGTGMVALKFSDFTPFFLNHLPKPVGGLGFFATHMFYYPQHDVHVVMNFHTYERMRQSFIVHIAIAQQIAKLRAATLSPTPTPTPTQTP